MVQLHRKKKIFHSTNIFQESTTKFFNIPVINKIAVSTTKFDTCSLTILSFLTQQIYFHINIKSCKYCYFFSTNIFSSRLLLFYSTNIFSSRLLKIFLLVLNKYIFKSFIENVSFGLVQKVSINIRLILAELYKMAKRF